MNSILLYSNLILQTPRYYEPPCSREKIRIVPTTGCRPERSAVAIADPLGHSTPSWPLDALWSSRRPVGSPFWLLGALLTTYRPLSHSHPLGHGHSATSRRPGPPGRRRGTGAEAVTARAGIFCREPQLGPPRYFNRSQAWGRRRSRAKIPRIQVLKPELETPELGHFPRNRSWSRGSRGIKL